MPTPTPTPSDTTLPVTARPLASGDTFAYAGTSLRSFVYYGATPNPSVTLVDTISQSVIDKGTSAFNGANPYDLNIAEVDLSKTERLTIATDAYVAVAPYNGAQTGYYTYGYTSTDSSGQTISDEYGNVRGGNGLLDILPERSGATWSNDGAQTIAESEADGSSSRRVVAAGGAYSETDTYPQTSQSGTPPPLIATLVERADGSGTYDTPIFGSNDQTFSYSAPAGGIITIDAPGEPFGFTVKQWYVLPLYAEHDRNDGTLTLPAACHVPSKFGAIANAIEQQITKADTVLGTLETFDQLTYVAGGYALCTTLTDTTQMFYDYSGQGNQPPNGLSFSGGTTPLEVETFTSTQGLTATNVTGADRTRALQRTGASGVSMRSNVFAANFLAMLERRRLARIRNTAVHLRSLGSHGSHR